MSGQHKANQQSSGDAAALRGRLARVLREPLTVFMLVAAGIFAFDAVVERDRSYSDQASASYATVLDEPIVVTPPVVSALQEDFTWLHGRAPDQAETDLLVQRWIEDEVVFREGLSQQMHLTDAMVRAAVIDKVRLLWAGVPDSPTEAELLNFYLVNMDKYYAEPRVTFEQVFFNSEPENASMLLKRLKRGEQVQGNGYWLGDTMTDYARSILRSNFGGSFYKSLVTAPLDEWIGPLRSSRGHHYVRVSEIRQPEPYAYESIRDRVARDWHEYQRTSRITEQTLALMGNYDIVRDPVIGQEPENDQK